MNGISSMRSYDVKRRPQDRHSRRRRMTRPSLPSRESTTLSSMCAQKGHFMAGRLPFSPGDAGHLADFGRTDPAMPHEEKPQGDGRTKRDGVKGHGCRRRALLWAAYETGPRVY